MARPSRMGGKTGMTKTRKAKTRNLVRTKSITPTGTAANRSTAAIIKELDEAREQQAASAEILKVIASSPSDVQPVLQALATSALRLCDALSVTVLLRDG